MRSVDIEIPCMVYMDRGPYGEPAHQPRMLSISLRVTAGDHESTEDVLARVTEALQGKLGLFDLGDET